MSLSAVSSVTQLLLTFNASRLCTGIFMRPGVLPAECCDLLSGARCCCGARVVLELPVGCSRRYEHVVLALASSFAARGPPIGIDVVVLSMPPAVSQVKCYNRPFPPFARAARASQFACKFARVVVY